MDGIAKEDIVCFSFSRVGALTFYPFSSGASRAATFFPAWGARLHRATSGGDELHHRTPFASLVLGSHIRPRSLVVKWTERDQRRRRAGHHIPGDQRSQVTRKLDSLSTSAKPAAWSTVSCRTGLWGRASVGAHSPEAARGKPRRRTPWKAGRGAQARDQASRWRHPPPTGRHRGTARRRSTPWWLRPPLAVCSAAPRRVLSGKCRTAWSTSTGGDLSRGP